MTEDKKRGKGKENSASATTKASSVVKKGVSDKSDKSDKQTDKNNNPPPPIQLSSDGQMLSLLLDIKKSQEDQAKTLKDLTEKVNILDKICIAANTMKVGKKCHAQVVLEKQKVSQY